MDISMLPSHTHFTPGAFVEHVDTRSITPASEAHSAHNGFPMMEYAEYAQHGLPVTYHQHYPTPNEDGQHIPFGYPESAPDQDFPPDALPGPVHRGNTGYSSGVGTFHISDI